MENLKTGWFPLPFLLDAQTPFPFGSEIAQHTTHFGGHCRTFFATWSVELSFSAVSPWTGYIFSFAFFPLEVDKFLFCISCFPLPGCWWFNFNGLSITEQSWIRRNQPEHIISTTLFDEGIHHSLQPRIVCRFVLFINIVVSYFYINSLKMVIWGLFHNSLL